MRPQISFKKPVTNSMSFNRRSSLIKKPKISIRKSTKYDVRPIRNDEWIKDSKNKLIQFLQDIDYQQEIDPGKLSRLSSVDVRRLFEHIIKVMSSNFQFSECNQNWEDVIFKFYTNIGYPGNLTKTHFCNPSIRSSVPIVLAAFDYLRRIVCVYIKTNPKMMFPRINNFNENKCLYVSESLIELYNSTDQESDTVKLVEKLQKCIFKRFGLLTEEELIEKQSEITHMEELLNQRNKLETKLSKGKETKKELKSIIDIEINSKNEYMDHIHHIAAMKVKTQREIDSLIENKNRLSKKYENLRENGTLNIVKSIGSVQSKIEDLRINRNEINLIIEKKQDELRDLETQFNSFRLGALNQLSYVFRTLEDMNCQNLLNSIQNCTIDDFLNSTSTLHYSLKQFEEKMSSEVNSLETQLIEIKQRRESEEDTLKLTVRETQELEDSDQQLNEELNNLKMRLENLEYEERECYTLNKKLRIEYDDILEEMNALTDDLDCAMNDFKKDQIETGKIDNFYTTDIDFNKLTADTKLEGLQNEWGLCQSLSEDMKLIIKELQSNVNEN